MKSVRYYLVHLGFEILRKTRRAGALIIDVADVDKEIWDKCWDKGRITVLYDFNIKGGGREVMIGDFKRMNMTHQEYLRLKELT